MVKEKKQTERFEGGIEGLFLYHRACHVLLSCLLVPLIASGAFGLWRLPGTGPVSYMPLVLTGLMTIGWFSSSSLNSTAMGHLVIYASEGDPAEKSARWRSILWYTLAINLAGGASVAALLALLHALAGDLEPTLDLQVAQHFVINAFVIMILPNALLVDNHGIGIRRWALVILAYFAACIHFSLLDTSFIMLPHALGLTIYLLGRLVRQQRLRDHLFVTACEIFSMAGVFLFFAIIAPGGLGFDWRETAFLAFAGAISAFTLQERIRRGLFSTVPEFIERKMPGGSKERVKRILNPLERTPRRWKWVRLVLRAAPYAWLVALLSTIVAVAARLASF